VCGVVPEDPILSLFLERIHYFEDIATERLIGAEITPDHLNEYTMGETLDAIAEYGTSRLFTAISLQMMEKFQFDGQRLHHDTTSFCVHGQYDSDFGTKVIQIVKGHSKDHREDLKQFVVSLVTNQHGIPVFMKPLSGNTSDKKTLLQSIQAVRQNLNIDGTIYHMADSALYSEENVMKLGNQCYWISHVPATIGEAKKLIASDVIWTQCTDARYKYVIFESKYGGVDQRWVLFHTSVGCEEKEEKFRSKVNENLKSDQSTLNKLCAKGYACEADARIIVDRWMTKNPRYLIDTIEVNRSDKKKTKRKGRPRKDEEMESVFRISCTLRLNEEYVTKECQWIGRFILASNDCEIDPETLLSYYKEQNSVERGFKFLKDRTFHAAEIYLKNENRIAALSMIMVLCLMVYTVAEWFVRKLLKENSATVNNKKNKPTDRPTMETVFFRFRRVRQILEITENGAVCRLLNVRPDLLSLLHLLGPQFTKYYA